MTNINLDPATAASYADYLVAEYEDGQSMEHLLHLADLPEMMTDGKVDIIESRLMRKYQHIAYYYNDHSMVVIEPFTEKQAIRKLTLEQYDQAFPEHEKDFWGDCDNLWKFGGI